MQSCKGQYTIYFTTLRMYPVFSFLVFVLLALVHCQDPRKRLVDSSDYQKDDDLPCTMKNCYKRSANQEDMGPFWANRGKKDPSYSSDKFMIQEPHWILIKKDPEVEPFFTSRGKRPLKYVYDDSVKPPRDRRDYVVDGEMDPAFFAARGKKNMDK
uniref:Natalisin n=1 Tax=Rhynchophorus ferrugineus TaxID=354439 RepID=A0A5Q0TWX6_RHYFE|nr:natalisin [Rhynchophorus ferrugineus]